MNAIPNLFERQRYVVVPALLTEPLLRFLWRYACDRADGGTIDPGDAYVPGAPCGYGDSVMEHMLERLRPQIEDATGASLYPTYSYYRIYGSGHRLSRHYDRPACEISVSVTLGVEGSEVWPLYVEGPNGCDAPRLQPGDGLVYRGIECAHWRLPFTGVRQAQMFLHYVTQSGPHREWRFDKRPGLALTPPLPI